MVLRVTYHSLVLLIVALFSLGTVGNSLAAGHMQADGTEGSVMQGVPPHGDSDTCDSDQISASDAACQAQCATQILSAGLSKIHGAGIRLQVAVAESPLGHSGPPDPYPPRLDVLS